MRLAILAVAAVAGCRDTPTTSARARGDAAAARSPDATPTRPCRPGPAVADPDGLAFLVDVGGRLHIELSEAPVKISPGLENRKAPPTATITKVELEVYRFVDGDLKPLTDAELDRVVFRGTELQLRGLGAPVTHTAQDCDFTVRDLVEAVEATERQTRADSDWYDGIDVHHVYFEGLSGGADDGIWDIGWGS